MLLITIMLVVFVYVYHMFYSFISFLGLVEVERVPQMEMYTSLLETWEICSKRVVPLVNIVFDKAVLLKFTPEILIKMKQTLLFPLYNFMPLLKEYGEDFNPEKELLSAKQMVDYYTSIIFGYNGILELLRYLFITVEKLDFSPEDISAYKSEINEIYMLLYKHKNIVDRYLQEQKE